MKTMRGKRILTACLTAILLMSALSVLALPTGAASYVKSIQNGTGTRSAESIYAPFSYRVNVLGEFTAFGFAMPTWTRDDSVCRLSLYLWSGTYEDTLKQEPIATKVFDPMRDNATNTVTFDPQPAGEYLFHVSEPQGSVGVWANVNPTDSLGYAYKDGTESKSLEPELHITFTENLNEPFGACEPSIPPVDGNHTAPAEYVIPEDSKIYTHEVMPDTWVFTDGLGRVSLTNAEVGDPRTDRTLALFYWTWHGFLRTGDPFNNQKFLEENPDALRDYDHPGWPVSGYDHFWNQPVYGYYKTTDTWVLRRQAEMLANAGVDTIFTDNTNGILTWRDSYRPLMQTWSDAMDDGVRTPKVSFMLPFGANEDTRAQLKDLYLDIYRKDVNQKLWFYWEGKPMLMAHGGGNLLNSADNTEKEIKKFFTFRANYPGYINNNPGLAAWGWLSTYPQAVYYGTSRNQKEQKPEQITVGVAMNHDYKLGLLAAMNGYHIMGRSYTSSYQDRYEKEGASATLWGYNFSEQFDYALKVDPKVVFVTGWNEWVAGRYKTWIEGSAAAVENAFPDQCNDEFSRDLEPTRGDLRDNYYYLLVNYVRRYKGARPIPTPSQAATIDLGKGTEQWASVAPYYAAYIGNTGDRDADGYGSLHYTEYSGRNDIIGARVARDDDYVYFLAECNEEITPYTDPLWMVLYIDSDQSNQGWESFDYVINKSPASADTAVLEKFTGNGYASEKVADVKYSVNGKTIQIAVPKSALGLSGYDFTINFSWTDNVHDADDAAPNGQSEYVYSRFSGDIMEFYVSGDVAPGGRFKYSYISTAANAGAESATGTDTETVTEPAPVTATDSEASDSGTVTAPDSDTTGSETTAAGGCRSSIGVGAAAGLVALAGVPLVAAAGKNETRVRNSRRKKERGDKP